MLMISLYCYLKSCATTAHLWYYSVQETKNHISNSRQCKTAKQEETIQQLSLWAVNSRRSRRSAERVDFGIEEKHLARCREEEVEGEGLSKDILARRGDSNSEWLLTTANMFMQIITDQVREEGAARKNSIVTTTTSGRLHQSHSHSSEPEMKEPQLAIIYEIWSTIPWTQQHVNFQALSHQKFCPVNSN